MKFADYDVPEGKYFEWVTLEEVAAAIAPLLKPLLAEQPAPADVADEAARITALEHDIDDVCKERDWFMARLYEAMQAQPTPARLLAVDKKREVAERALADAQQEIEALKAQVKAIPWDSLELLECSAYVKLPGEVLKWYNAHSPYRQEA